MNVTTTLKVVTNNHRREIISEFQLTEAEQAEFDYLDWEAMKRGEDSASFIRYRGELYDLGDLMSAADIPELAAEGWGSYISETYWSGLVFKLVGPDDMNDWTIVVGRYDLVI